VSYLKKRGGNVTMTRKKKNFGLIFPLVVGFLLLTFLGACKSEEKMEEESESMIISKNMLIPVFGQGEGSISGLLDVEQSSDELKISYYYFIEDMTYFDEEIERDLAPKIQKLYRDIPEIDRVAFTIYVPTLAEEPYKPYVSFVVTRKLVEETEWDNLLELEFFNVVMDVKYYD
jgi:hypothetical protein